VLVQCYLPVARLTAMALGFQLRSRGPQVELNDSGGKALARRRALRPRIFMPGGLFWSIHLINARERT
jgi:hypothetical protein